MLFCQNLASYERWLSVSVWVVFFFFFILIAFSYSNSCLSARRIIFLTRLHNIHIIPKEIKERCLSTIIYQTSCISDRFQKMRKKFSPALFFMFTRVWNINTRSFRSSADYDFVVVVKLYIRSNTNNKRFKIEFSFSLCPNSIRKIISARLLYATREKKLSPNWELWELKMFKNLLPFHYIFNEVLILHLRWAYSNILNVFFFSPLWIYSSVASCNQLN